MRRGRWRGQVGRPQSMCRVPALCELDQGLRVQRVQRRASRWHMLGVWWWRWW